MTRARRSIVLTLLLLMSCPRWAGAQEETVTEPASGVQFPVKSKDGLVLLGVGIRKFLMIKGYATAMYVEPEGFRKAVADRSLRGLADSVMDGKYTRRLLLHFLRHVSGEKVRDVFRAALKKSMTPEDYAAEEKEIEGFLAGCWDLEKGEVFTLYSAAGGKTQILQGSRVVYDGSSRRLARGMWGGYFGKTPVCQKLQDSMLTRAALILDGRGAGGGGGAKPSGSSTK
jgi:hypothetical protein